MKVIGRDEGCSLLDLEMRKAFTKRIHSLYGNRFQNNFESLNINIDNRLDQRCKRKATIL